MKKGYVNNSICPCVFIKKTTSGCVIIAVYVDDLNIIGTNKEIQEVVLYLKEEFEMKDLGKPKYCPSCKLNKKNVKYLFTRKIIQKRSLNVLIWINQIL